ncbi:MAG: hypothetical protein M0C28_36280 [Candidatus Moduliflexus flocculans]|nr:hypothetical protein [Candidatus Moduliflexus flocculans]
MGWIRAWADQTPGCHAALLDSDVTGAAKIWFEMIIGNLTRLSFWWFDVRPAINKRKRSPQDDVVFAMLFQEQKQLGHLC